jgi:imidazolonepropionase-like amidohydrolase
LSHGETPEAKATVESWCKLRTPGDAEAFVDQQITRSGASYIKIMHEVGNTLNIDMPKPNVDIWKAVVAAAHARGLVVVGHAYSHEGAVDLLTAGVDGLTHMFLDKPPSDDYIKLALKNGAHCNPTLIGNASQSKQGHQLQVEFAEDPFAQKMLFDTTPRKYLGLANDRADIEHSYNSTRALYAAGVPLIVGSDASGQPRGQAYGLTVHMEMHQMVHKIGMSAADVLKGVTSLIADRFRFQDTGRVAIGKKADLVLVEGDIREVLSNPRTRCLPIRGVWREGVLATGYGEENI